MKCHHCFKHALHVAHWNVPELLNYVINKRLRDDLGRKGDPHSGQKILKYYSLHEDESITCNRSTAPEALAHQEQPGSPCLLSWVSAPCMANCTVSPKQWTGGPINCGM